MLAPNSLFDGGSSSLHQLVIAAVEAADPDMRMELLQHVVLSGGNTCFPGFASRLQEELVASFPRHRVVVHAPDNMQHLR